MTTLDLRGSGGTLRLARNGGGATIRSFLVLGPTGATGPAGAVGPAGPAGPSGPALPAAQLTALAGTYVAFGPTLPTLPSGTEYVWNKTDGAGTLLDIVSGVA